MSQAPDRHREHADAGAAADRRLMQRLAVDWTGAQPVVAAFISGLVFNHHDAEDILQRTAAALVGKYGDYDPSQSFVKWAIGIARIEVLRYRQERGRERASFDTETVEAVSMAFEEISPEIPEMRAALDRCIGKLRGRVREIFELHYIQDLTPSQIAARLNRKTSAVFVAMHRGRAAVRECLRRQLQMEGAE